MEIVNTNINYTYEIMINDINKLKNRYEFIENGSIGYSVLGKNMPYIKIGRGVKEVLYTAAFHANEWITSVLLMKFVENFCIAYETNSDIYGYNARQIFDMTSIYLVPMVNPDGVNLVTGAVPRDSGVYRKFQSLANNYPQISFPSGWKANFNGVDLNLQFPARWERAKEIKFEQGYTKPGPRNFVGTGPLTEPEAIAVYDFTIKHTFKLILAYHTQGEVIYWRFSNYMPLGAEFIGNEFARVSGYSLETTPSESANAGFKDWFISEYNRPGYTIEAGWGENPLPISQFDQIYTDNIGILVLGAVI